MYSPLQHLSTGTWGKRKFSSLLFYQGLRGESYDNKLRLGQENSINVIEDNKDDACLKKKKLPPLSPQKSPNLTIQTAGKDVKQLSFTAGGKEKMIQLFWKTV